MPSFAPAFMFVIFVPAPQNAKMICPGALARVFDAQIALKSHLLCQKMSQKRSDLLLPANEKKWYDFDMSRREKPMSRCGGQTRVEGQLFPARGLKQIGHWQQR